MHGRAMTSALPSLPHQFAVELPQSSPAPLLAPLTAAASEPTNHLIGGRAPPSRFFPSLLSFFFHALHGQPLLPCSLPASLQTEYERRRGAAAETGGGAGISGSGWAATRREADGAAAAWMESLCEIAGPRTWHARRTFLRLFLRQPAHGITAAAAR